MTMDKEKKIYLGDGVYLSHDGYQYVLTTDDGLVVTNTIYLDPQVTAALIAILTGNKNDQ